MTVATKVEVWVPSRLIDSEAAPHMSTRPPRLLSAFAKERHVSGLG